MTNADTAARPAVAVPSLERQRRVFLVVLTAALAACAAFAVLLEPALFPESLREGASSVGLVLSGLFLGVSCWRRSRLTTGRRRRSWRLIMAAAVVALLGNLWAGVVGTDPVLDPSLVSDGSIIVGLCLGIAGVLNFPAARRRGSDLVVIMLDGLVIGCAVLIIASTLVYSELLRRTEGTVASQAATLVIPVIDVILAVTALFLLLRSTGSDRQALAFLALGNIGYVLSDLPFAVLVAESRFEFGTPLDLGWIVGYAVLALAAWYPSVVTDRPEEAETPSRVADTALVFSVLVVAVIVQVVAGSGDRVGPVTAFLWLVLAVAAASRQIVLTRDNNVLRRGLEKRVAAQTADLARMARQTEVLLTSVGDGIYGVDADGRVTFVNPSGAAALGYETHELDGRGAHATFHAPSEDGHPYPYEGCYIAEAISAGAVTNAEEDVYLRADGSSFPVEITASPLLDGEDVRGAVVVFRDVTQRREVDRMKDEFISVVSHELRTPLTSIRGSLGLLASGKLGELTPRAQSMASIALESSERLTRLINDILDLERIESGTRPMDIAPVDATHLLSRSVAEMAGLARQTGIRLDVAPSTGRVLADGDRVVQTLTNLLNNAIKFSTEGQTVVLDAVPQNGQVVFRVRDQGRGIPEDKLDAVFQRFEQVDSSDARQMGGTGLGLAISRGIVERHGGRIWAESAPGAGTTVVFTLPAAGRTERPDLGVAHGRGLPGAVLLVEDDDDLADVLITQLTGHAVPVERASGVREAVGLATETNPRLLVLDVELADGSGFDVVEELRRSPRTAAVDTIIYSADDVDPAERPRLTLGRTRFLTKGRVDPAALEDHILEMLDRPTSGGSTA